MKDFSTHTINGIPFIIGQDTNGWFWTNATDESAGVFPVQSEAIADALRWVNAQAEEKADQAEDEGQRRTYGSYEQQVQSLYNATRL